VRKFGENDDLSVLGAIAHAEAVTISMYADQPGSDPTAPRTLNVGPNRDLGRVEAMLFVVAYECVALTSGLAAAFDVAIDLPGDLHEGLAKGGAAIGVSG
jgi:hypothetical protein